jgi:hypothetical protein
MKFNGTVEELEKHLKTFTKREDVAALLEGEDRTTAKDAINARLKELDEAASSDTGTAGDDGQGKTGATSHAADGTSQHEKPQPAAEDQSPEANPESILSPDGPQPGDSPYVGTGEESRAAVDHPADPPAASSVDYLDHSAPATDSHVMQERLNKVLDNLPK